jgi:hypothetical protein
MPRNGFDNGAALARDTIMNPIGWRLLLALTFGAPFAGCISVSTSQPAATAARSAGAQVLDRLYCGGSIPQGGEVSDDAWARFVAEVVTPRFPSGFTVFRARGQWLGSDGQIARETTMVIEVTHADDAASDRAVEAIAIAYKQRFGQEAVLRIRQPAAMKLY